MWESLLAKATKRKAFISFYQGDNAWVDKFIQDFGDVFTPKVLGANSNDDFINSNDTAYVMSRIRQLYLGDSSVTINLIGNCTHSRRYVDWELKSSLTQGQSLPNGVLGIILPYKNGVAHFPERLLSNWNEGNLNCYAKVYRYPQSSDELRGWIEDAYEARTTRAHLINNTRDMMRYNKTCDIHGITH